MSRRRNLRRRVRTTGNASDLEALLERALRDVLEIYWKSDSDGEFREKLIANGWRTTRNPTILCHNGYSDDYRICFDVQQLHLQQRSPVFASKKGVVYSDTIALPERWWRQIMAEYLT